MDRPLDVEELLRMLAREDVRPRPAFKVQLTERLIAAMAARQRAFGWRLALAGAAAFLLLAVLAGWLLTPRVSTWATLAVERGEAQVAWQRPLYFRWTRSGIAAVSGGQEFLLAEGDRVTLSEDGIGSIAFSDGSRLYLKGATALAVEELDSARMVTRVRLMAGEARAVISPYPGRLFEVGTNAASVVARSTVFRTRVVADDHTYSATDEGTTQVTLLDPAQGYPSVEVPAGYEVDAIIGQPLQVRPQAPVIDHLSLNGETVQVEELLVANRSELVISGRAGIVQGCAVLLSGETIVGRTPIAPEGEFSLRFRAPEEGEYRLCVAVETPDGIRGPCLFLTYFYDATPPRILRLLEPTTSEIHGATVALRGETEPGAVVRLNGQLLPVDAAGAFAARWALQPGENPMVLEACDAAGNCARLEFTLIRR